MGVFKREWLRVDFAHRFELEVHGSKVRSSEGFGPSSDVVGTTALANPGADCITGETKLASLLKQGPKRESRTTQPKTLKVEK